MPRFLQRASRALGRSFWRGASASLFLLSLGAAGCGEVSCPEALSEVDGVCTGLDPFLDEDPDADPGAGPDEGAVEERCDGVDNDGDDAVDEDWPELGTPCGEGVGECEPGEYVCAHDGAGVVCEGAVGPVAEVCDVKDNDCDGLIDEGVWSVKQEILADHASVAAVDGGFVVSRLVFGQLRVETYDARGVRTGHHDDIASPSSVNAFLESDVAGRRFVVALGQHRFYVLEGDVDSELVPIILGTQRLHDQWDQGIDWGVYHPPYHPRVSALPARFVGHRDLVTFALSPFEPDGLDRLADAPREVSALPFHAYFDADGSFVVWEQSGNVRAGLLTDEGSLLLDIDVARGGKPAVGVVEDGPGVAFLQSGKLMLSELGGLTLQCRAGAFCNTQVDSIPVEEHPTTALGLARDAATDTWVIAADDRVLAVGRGPRGEAVVKQRVESSLGGETPVRIDVATSAGTTAILQTAEQGESALTFMGCL